MDFLQTIEYWHWLVFGLLLFVLEIFVAGAVFLWLGLAALVLAVLVLALPALMWMPQLLIWSVLAVAGAYGWQLYRRKHPPVSPSPTMNRRGEQYVGRHFTLSRDIINGTGELHVDDTRWKIVSYKDLPMGTKVTVKSVEGTSLRVEEYIS